MFFFYNNVASDIFLCGMRRCHFHPFSLLFGGRKKEEEEEEEWIFFFFSIFMGPNGKEVIQS